MKYNYTPRGVCSRQLEFEVENGIVHNISFFGGCHGNLQGISKLAEGRSVDEVISLLRGIRCGMKPTSCPDQLAKALESSRRR